VRAFALEQLGQDERAAAEARHATYFTARAEEAEPHLRGGPHQARWLQALEADMDNLRAALAPRPSPAGMPDDGGELRLRLAGALGWFWVVRGHWREGLRWLRRVLQETAGSGADGAGTLSEAPGGGLARARALPAAAGLASALNLFEECRSYCDQGLALCHRIGDRRGAAFCTALLGAVATRRGEYREGNALLEEGLAAFRALEDPWGTAFALDNLAHARRDQQDYERAAALYEEALSLRRAMEDRQGEAMSLSNLADASQLGGDWARAAALHEASLERFRAIGDRAGAGYGLRRLGECALQAGDAPRAEVLNRESLALFAGLGDRRRIAECLEKTALLRAEQGRTTEATRLLGAADDLRGGIGIPMPPSERHLVEGAAARLRSELGDGGFEHAWARGQALDLEAAIAEALG